MYNIIEQLGFSKSKNIYNYTKNIDLDSLPLRINKSLHAMTISPQYIFILNNKPIILFFSEQIHSETVFKQCWNFAETPIIIIENEVDFDVYNGFDYIHQNGKFLLSEIAQKDDLTYISIVSGKYFENSKDIFDKNDKKVDKKLLENIKEARKKLLNLNLKDHIDIANALLGRVIFIRYLIDRKVLLKFENKHKALTNEELKIILSSKKRTYDLFRYLNVKRKGKMYQ